MVFEMYLDSKGYWHWRLKANDEIGFIAYSAGEGFYSPYECSNAIRLVQRSASAQIIQVK
ncbi:DUF1508 domain-containing protein [Chroococcus sp. FPU101]|uniref:YegP family protein n=1 Tax=Chroococcus sp. FPU101 TaxID=1974212 RepID=UPI001A8E2685|nr:DUF1508 domain-containing protein [Chroococcus sp. FPU101]GFE72308.1 hypothetical protein CFPU101_49180 [Chroococcus sp. FPU101]